VVVSTCNTTRNVAVVLHCNLRLPNVALVVLCINYEAHTKFEDVSLSVPDL